MQLSVWQVRPAGDTQQAKELNLPKANTLSISGWLMRMK
jgi:hypothetical protein